MARMRCPIIANGAVTARRFSTCAGDRGPLVLQRDMICQKSSRRNSLIAYHLVTVGRCFAPSTAGAIALEAGEVMYSHMAMRSQSTGPGMMLTPDAPPPLPPPPHPPPPPKPSRSRHGRRIASICPTCTAGGGGQPRPARLRLPRLRCTAVNRCLRICRAIIKDGGPQHSDAGWRGHLSVAGDRIGQRGGRRGQAPPSS